MDNHTETEITIEELKKRFPDWKPTSPEQEQKMLELVKKAMRFCHDDPTLE